MVIATKPFRPSTVPFRPSKVLCWLATRERSAAPGGDVLDVRDARRLDRAHLLELEGVPLETLEEPFAAAENDRDDRDVDLVDKASREVLIDDGCAPGQRDVLAFGGVLRLTERGLDAVGDEVEGRTALHHEGLARVVGEDEHRVVVGRVLAPPAAPGNVRPFTADRPEHVATHDRRADVLPALLDDGRTGVGLASHLAVRLPELPEGEDPLV